MDGHGLRRGRAAIPDAEIFIGLLTAIVLFAELSRPLRVPAPVLLVLGGLALGFVPGLPRPTLDPDTFFFLFLPPLLYSAAFVFSTEDLKAHADDIFLLAVGLVAATTVAVAAIAHAVAGLPWASAFVLGAVVGSTDPVSATSVIRRVGAPKRIVTVLEGEALVNDGTALVAYRLAIGAAGAAAFSVGHALAEFVWVSAGGIAIGVVVGWLAVWGRRWLTVPEVEITFSLVMPFAAYFPAERAGVSGVLATVAAGLVAGSRAHEMSPAARLQGHAFWEQLAFLLNSALFLLVGLSFPDIVRAAGDVSAGELVLEAAVLAAAVMGLRVAWMFVVPRVVAVLEPARKGDRPTIGELVVLGWSGMRGGVTLAAALAVPLTVDGRPFPGRERIIVLAYLVLLATLVVPALTLGPLIARLGIATGEAQARADAAARAHILRAAVEHIDELAASEALPVEIADRLRDVYRERLDRIDAGGPEPSPDGGGAAESAAEQAARSGAVEAQRAALAGLVERHEIGERAAREVERELDREERRSTDAAAAP